MDRMNPRTACSSMWGTGPPTCTSGRARCSKAPCRYDGDMTFGVTGDDEHGRDGRRAQRSTRSLFVPSDIVIGHLVPRPWSSGVASSPVIASGKGPQTPAQCYLRCTPIEEVVVGARSPLHKSCGDDFAWSLLDATPDATDATDELRIEPRLQFNDPIEWMEVHTGDHRTPVLKRCATSPRSGMSAWRGRWTTSP